MTFFRHTVDTIEDVSCTDVKQQWGHLKKQKEDLYRIVPLQAYCHVKAPKDTFDIVLSEEEAGRALQTILDSDDINLINYI